AEDALETDDESELGLKVQPGAGPEGRGVGARRDELAAWPAGWGPGPPPRPRPAVVAARQVPPVRRQRLGSWPEDPAGVCRMVLGGIEVGVVGDGKGHVHLDPCGRYQQVLDGLATGVPAE